MVATKRCESGAALLHGCGQRVDAATRKVCGVKSKASRADLPMSKELEARLRTHLQRHDGKNDLLFVHGRSRPFSANKLRTKRLHPLLDKLRIDRGSCHSMRHGAASSLLADGATPAVVQRQLRHSDARITLRIYGHVIGNEQRDAVQDRSSKLVNWSIVRKPGYVRNRGCKLQKIGLVGAAGIESTNYMETKEFCGVAGPSKAFKGTQWNP